MSNRGTHLGIYLGGQVAIVTGGGRDIGRAMALALARAGAAVAVVARSADQLAQTVSLVEEMSGRAMASVADVTDQRDPILSQIDKASSARRPCYDKLQIRIE
jgi:3-oxoacyl-[acyl-carrier protein] reductase